jgi:hypothetical protein
VIHEGVKQELRRIEEQWHMNPPEPQLEAPAQMMQQPLFGAPVTQSAPVTQTAPVTQSAPVTQTSQVAQPPQTAPSVPVSTARRMWADAVVIDADRVRLVDALKLNAQPGSQWALFGPDETRFDYGAALAVGSVESVNGTDAILRLSIRTRPVPAHARAIAIAPPDLSNTVPVRLVGVPAERAAVLLEGIRRQVEVRNVGDSEFYRFLIENRGGAWNVMDARGVRTLMSFRDGSDAAVAERLAGVLRRSSRAMALLSLENLASDLRLWVGVQTAASASRPASPGATRDIVLVSNDVAPTYRIRRAGEPRTHENSLIVEIQAAQPAYITVVDVDAEGGVYQLFPAPQQRDGFLPAGLIPANQLVRIPDSLAPANAAGFYWDYSPPVGLDTVRVFATTNLESAQSIRKFIADASADARALGELRSELAAAATRGVRVTTDEAEPAPTGPATSATQNPVIAGEWNATSVTINVRE